MKKKAGTYPKTKERYVVCLTDGINNYRSRTYKTERGVIGAARRMKKRYRHLGYEVTVGVAKEVI